MGKGVQESKVYIMILSLSVDPSGIWTQHQQDIAGQVTLPVVAKQLPAEIIAECDDFDATGYALM